MASKGVTNDVSTVNEDTLDYVLKFQRREYKYLIPSSLVDLLVPELLMYMNPDKYSNDGYYNLYSIYFDTHDWQAFYEKIDGIERRKKFRIRSYYPSPKPDDTVMLEVKEKNKDIIIKRRTPIKLKDVQKLVTGRKISNIHDPVVEEWRFNILRNGLKPRILIKYDRMAFMPKQHGDYRVTIDKAVSHASTNKPDDFQRRLTKTSWAHDNCVLEIKFDSHPPQFLLDLIKRYNLRNEAISKFSDSIMTHHKTHLN
jgi:SPX domain protein involved in polyphosphate accumulation